jgi:hypothetical protein
MGFFTVLLFAHHIPSHELCIHFSLLTAAAVHRYFPSLFELTCHLPSFIYCQLPANFACQPYQGLFLSRFAV